MRESTSSRSQVGLGASFALAILLCAWPGRAPGQESASALKADEIRAEPFADARAVGALKAGEALTLLRRQGGWAEVRAAQASGWVRLLSVRRGAGGPGRVPTSRPWLASPAAAPGPARWCPRRASGGWGRRT